MYRPDRKTLYFYVSSVLLLLFSRWSFLYRGSDNPLVLDSIRLFRHILLIVMVYAWCYSIRLRILNIDLKRYLLLIGLMMRVWMLLRMFKWEFLPSPSFLHRFCWYLYYIPILMIPVLGVFLAEYVGNTENYRESRRKKWFIIANVILILTVLTNDLHHLVFRFPEGTALYDSVYVYGWMYYVIFLWIIVLALLFVLTLIQKTRVPGRSFLKYLPMIILGTGFFYWGLFLFGKIEKDRVDVSAVICAVVIAVIEAFILNGMLPSNEQYGRLFRDYIDRVWIVDRNDRIVYQSAGSGSLSEAEIRSARQKPLEMGDEILYSAPIRGGSVLWLMNFSRINSLLHRLKETEELLNGEQDLIRAELELKKQEAENMEKAELFSRIARRLAPQIEETEKLLDCASQNPGSERKMLEKACVLGAYIKRYGNLLLLGSESEFLSSEELILCLREISESLNAAGIPSAADGTSMGRLHADLLTEGYCCAEMILENLLDSLLAIQFSVTEQESGIRLRMMAGITEKTAALDCVSGMDEFRRLGGTIQVSGDGTDLTIDLYFPKGGDEP